MNRDGGRCTLEGVVTKRTFASMRNLLSCLVLVVLMSVSQRIEKQGLKGI